MSANTADYTVYAYTFLDGTEVTDLVAFLADLDSACRLARYSLNLGACKAEVYEREDSGIYSLVYSAFTEEFNRNEVLESLLQLRDAGELMPDPEDSPFFATPCEPMAAV